MSDYKTKLINYAPFDYEYLEKMFEREARNGWFLEKAGIFTWKFKKGEPEDIKYSVVFNPDLSEYDPENNDVQKLYDESCLEKGWVRVCGKGKLQIYKTEKQDPLPIESDGSAKLSNIRRSVGVSYILPISIIALLLSLNGTSGLKGLICNTAEFMSDYVNLASGLLNIMIIISLLGFLILYGIWLHKSKKSVRQGGPCVSTLKYGKAFRCFSAVIYASFILSLITILLNGDHMTFAAFILAAFVLSIVLFGQKKMSQKGVGRNVNKAITIILAFVLTFGFFGALIWGSVVHDNDDEPISEARKDEIPVKAEDIFKVDTGKAEYEFDVHRTFILKHFSVGEYFEDGRNDFSFDYDLFVFADRKAIDGNLYKWCLWGLKSQGDRLERVADVYLGGQFKEIKKTDGVEKIYRYKGEDYKGEWLICFKNKILRLNTFWDADEDDIKKICDRFSSVN